MNEEFKLGDVVKIIHDMGGYCYFMLTDEDDSQIEYMPIRLAKKYQLVPNGFEKASEEDIEKWNSRLHNKNLHYSIKTKSLEIWNKQNAPSVG